ncbi:glutamine-hydrolyzing GMP synthase [Candidatus Woesearchaeota archaeon]|jgi:GMP synthase (glutamine-hydrolysing)|nr:glutamine-hydrolyzing GMP synthase [Candidatus Woesearchaeota archaeon]
MIVILDCGSQLTHNIARRVREFNVYCEVIPYNQKISQTNVEGIIISGSPASIHDENAPFYSKDIFEMGVPILGICYGMQSMTQILGGIVEKGDKREYGRMKIIVKENELFKGIPEKSDVWMSHGDRVKKIPNGFESIGISDNSPYAAMQNSSKKIYGVQFHPEVDHTEFGRKIIENFINICECKRNWTPSSFIEETIEKIKEEVGDKKVIGGVSGGVDSTIAAVLLSKAIGKNFIPVFVDHGMIRLNEAKEVLSIFKEKLDIKLNYVDAKKQFLDKLTGVKDPEKKRKIIGNEFINVFLNESKKYGQLDYLMQGTLYPDVIESVSVFGGPTSTIKSHHNVGGLPSKMKLNLIEPLRFLFKDEVRKVGEELGIPKVMVWRHPFPGPGLGIRIIGTISEKKIKILQKCDAIFIEELKDNDLYYDGKTWQAFAVLTASKSVGVMGDERTYENTIALRAVTSNDGMTADWAHLPYDVLGKISNRIINEVKGVNRVVYDITSKPPGTIEWE